MDIVVRKLEGDNLETEESKEVASSLKSVDLPFKITTGRHK